MLRSKELTKHQRDLIVERYRSGEGYKKISKALDISWNTVKGVINKWRKYGTTVTLSRSGRPSRVDKKTETKLVREDIERPETAVKEQQLSLASTGCSLQVTTLLYCSTFWAMGQASD